MKFARKGKKNESVSDVRSIFLNDEPSNLHSTTRGITNIRSRNGVFEIR